MAPSTNESDRETSLEKSECPGVSYIFRQSTPVGPTAEGCLYNKVAVDALTVIPRSCSTESVSNASILSLLSGKIVDVPVVSTIFPVAISQAFCCASGPRLPQSSKIREDSELFPWSILKVVDYITGYREAIE